MERGVFRTVRGTMTLKGAFAVIITFKGHLTFVGKGSMEFDFLADSGLVFADCLGNGSFSGTVGDSSKDDSSFLQSQMRKSICIVHVLPAFPAAVKHIKCKTKCHIYSSGNR